MTAGMAWMVAFGEWLVATSAQAALLIGVLLVVGRLLRHRLAPRWHYLLWLVVLLRLGLPWAPQSQLSLFNLYAPPDALQAISGAGLVAEGSPARQRPAPPPPARGTTDLRAGRGLEGLDLSLPEDSGEARSEPRPATAWLVLFWLWMGGVLILGGRASFRSVRLWLKIRKLKPVTRSWVQETLEACRRQLDLRASPVAVETAAVTSPALAGFYRPRVLLPVGLIDTLSQVDLRHVFLHELAHQKRWDVPAHWLASVLQILHWFNPLVWYGLHRMRADREVACDDLVLAHLAPGQAESYGHTLLRLAEWLQSVRRPLGVVALVENRSNLKARIEMISQRTQRKYWRPLVAVGVLAVISCAGLTNGRKPARKESSPVEQVLRKMDAHRLKGAEHWRRSCPATSAHGVCGATHGKSLHGIALRDRLPAQVAAARQHYAAILQLWNDGKVQRLVTGQTPAADSLRAKLRDDAAEARFMMAEFDLEPYLRLAVPKALDFNPRHPENAKKSMAQYAAWLKNKIKVGRTLIKRYMRTAKIRVKVQDRPLPSPRWTLASLVRKAQIFQEVAWRIRTTPTPRFLIGNPAGEEAYRNNLESFAAPLTAKAQTAYKTCVKVAKKLQVAETDPWLAVCKRALGS